MDFYKNKGSIHQENIATQNVYILKRGGREGCHPSGPKEEFCLIMNQT